MNPLWCRLAPVSLALSYAKLTWPPLWLTLEHLSAEKTGGDTLNCECSVFTHFNYTIHSTALLNHLFVLVFSFVMQIWVFRSLQGRQVSENCFIKSRSAGDLGLTRASHKWIQLRALEGEFLCDTIDSVCITYSRLFYFSPLRANAYTFNVLMLIRGMHQKRDLISVALNK